MAATSSIQKGFKYDVFLSFRGEDTRTNFVDHLYDALHRNGIRTYNEYETIEKRRKISDQLITAIEDSRFHIIVFSKNYASSSWCLKELEKIMECHKTGEHTAYPIFYDVEAGEIRKQIGVVGQAFDKHEKDEAAGRWREALKEAGNLCGWELKNTFDGHEVKLIQIIIEEISRNLPYITSSSDENLIGMETRVKDVVLSLQIGYDDVRMIGIKGMGGGGKTALARAVFDHISFQFEGRSFVENVREVSRGSGLKELQKQVLSEVLDDQSIVVKHVSEGKNMMKRMMPSRKVLVVLDDVDDIDQLEALAGEPSWFKLGSRIIVTTRNEHLLVAHRVNFIHGVTLLSHEEAICLLSRYAFRSEIPIQGFEELSQNIVHYAAGLPLTIKVLGSFLCGRTECEWKYTLKRLKTIPLKETLEILEVSYNDLEEEYKEIFLDVACILKGERKDEAIRILNSCEFNAELGLKVLEERSLITISDTGHLSMHDHIEEMGWNIVRRVDPDEPTRHSRLWNKEEIEDVLHKDSGTEATKSIKLLTTQLSPDIIMKGLTKMTKLRLLYVDDGYQTDVYTPSSGYTYANLPNSLRCVCWRGYPLSCLPKMFQAEKLVYLEMRESSISQVWEGGERKVLNKLRFLDLKFSKLRTFDLGITPCLERLDLRGCNDFVGLQMPFECPKLKFLDLSGSMLRNLDLGLTPYLEELHLEECNYLSKLHMPFECPKLKYLGLGGSMVSNLNLGLTPHLEKLDLRGCYDLVELDMPVKLPKLKYLNLNGSRLSNLNLGLTPYLEELHLEECNYLLELHIPVECPKLKFLNLGSSKLGDFDLGLTPHLEELTLSTEDKHLPDNIFEKLPEELGRLECLEELNIEGTGINRLPQSIFELEGLRIVWSRGLLESHGFTSFIEISPYTASCYIKSKKALTTGVSSTG
ncbi:putative TIR domain, P-loop containing nucleoside triphosphate hydrolase [Helianthus annuus]|nr:putative TIR domain, P-loop containing nucleoside triphosphate hydrolase [Helianthus annuus]